MDVLPFTVPARALLFLLRGFTPPPVISYSTQTPTGSASRSFAYYNPYLKGLLQGKPALNVPLSLMTRDVSILAFAGKVTAAPCFVPVIGPTAL